MKEKVLILVKTYPTYSKKNFELVCTAGINENGEWRRIYPIPFRELSDIEKYKKYQWVEVDIEKNTSDPRPESYKLVLGSSIKVLGEPLTTNHNWQDRKMLLKKTVVYTKLDEIIHKANKENDLSLCQFQPTEICEFKIEPAEPEWSQDILEQIKRENAQGFLFENMQREIKLVDKLPYKFSYRFKDAVGKEPTLMIEDWEIGSLYWNCLKQANGNKELACQKVKEKYEGFIKNNDVTLFLGTTRQFHGWANDPFVIIGIFYPQKNNQQELF